MRTAAVLLSLALAACGGDADLPTAAELHGSWTNDEEGTVRNFVFAESGGAETYVLYSYPTGTTPVETQTGTYFVEGGVLVTEVETGTGAGQMFGNDIHAWTGTTLTLESESAASGERTFTKD